MTDLRSWLRRLLVRSGAGGDTHGSEADVATDPRLASSRATGGAHEHLRGDRGSVTGTGRTGEFVGQIAGDDLGYAEETGAERRATAEQQDLSEPGPEGRHGGPHPER